jgi:hypothetical protein
MPIDEFGRMSTQEMLKLGAVSIVVDEEAVTFATRI